MILACWGMGGWSAGWQGAWGPGGGRFTMNFGVFVDGRGGRGAYSSLAVWKQMVRG